MQFFKSPKLTTKPKTTVVNWQSTFNPPTYMYVISERVNETLVFIFLWLAFFNKKVVLKLLVATKDSFITHDRNDLTADKLRILFGEVAVTSPMAQFQKYCCKKDMDST